MICFFPFSSSSFVCSTLSFAKTWSSGAFTIALRGQRHSASRCPSLVSPLPSSYGFVSGCSVPLKKSVLECMHLLDHRRSGWFLHVST